ncbi:MAG: hypothetical protein IJI95_05260, partial [Clostridia bacterium]|nr:hypothetical protein [Clostridia bacterium]
KSFHPHGKTEQTCSVVFWENDSTGLLCFSFSPKSDRFEEAPLPGGPRETGQVFGMLNNCLDF